jgi:endonuclease/exonuclease/phosphatase family metal-dependent hydrolase
MPPRRGTIRRYAAFGAVALLAGLGLWARNASRPGARVEGCFDGCAAPPAGSRAGLRVMSMNVLHDIPRFRSLSDRLDIVAAEIRARDVDIALLQEVPWTLRLGSGARSLARATGLNHAYARANGNRRAIGFEEGETILSRYPLTDVTLVELQPRPGPFEHRVVLRATALTPWGDVDLYATHLTNGKPDVNRGQAASLQAFVASTRRNPAVVAGDLNALEDSPQIRALAGEWTDVYRAAHPGEAGFTCCIDDLWGGPDEPLRERIDYMFLVPGDGARIAVDGVRLVLNAPVEQAGGWLWASDHVGLLANLRLAP